MANITFLKVQQKISLPEAARTKKLKTQDTEKIMCLKKKNMSGFICVTCVGQEQLGVKHSPVSSKGF